MPMRDFHIKIIRVDSPISSLTGSTNCIVIWRKGVAVVVDPGGKGAKIASFLRRKNLTVGAYWLTHAHPDHVGGLSDLIGRFPAQIRYHKNDGAWLRACLPFLRIRKSSLFKPFGSIRRISCSGAVANVLISPGHSRGSVCYWFRDEGILLSGDTLMHGCVGATIWPGGNSRELEKSLRKVSVRVPAKTRVFPGHGRVTTIGAERD